MMIATIAVDGGFTRSLSATSLANSYLVSLIYAWSAGKPTIVHLNTATAIVYYRFESQMDC